MDREIVLGVVKERLGLRTVVRDTYLLAIVDGVLKELEDEKGLVLDGANPYHLIFVVDYVTWRYQSRDSDTGMPRHLQYRLHNLIIHVGSANLRVDSIIFVAALPVTPSAYTVYILSTDNSKWMYINGVWTAVNLVNGSWVVVVI